MYSQNNMAIYLNLSVHDYSFLMALTGAICGFVFLFFASYLVIEIGKK